MSQRMRLLPPISKSVAPEVLSLTHLASYGSMSVSISGRARYSPIHFFLPNTDLETAAKFHNAVICSKVVSEHFWEGDGITGTNRPLSLVEAKRICINTEGRVVRTWQDRNRVHKAKSWDRKGSYHRRIQKKWSAQDKGNKVYLPLMVNTHVLMSHRVLLGLSRASDTKGECCVRVRFLDKGLPQYEVEVVKC